ncbi:MAG: AI-2E family transporter, partial [Methylovulum sp.]|nr:AI-2E family transporter [Methylovulum sp.]
MINQDKSVNLRFLSKALRHVLPNNQAVSLAVLLVVIFLLIYFLSDLLMPVFVSIVIAYLLEGLTSHAEKLRIPRLLAVYLVFSGFMACLIFLLFYLIPIVSQQSVELVQHIPEIINRAQNSIMRLPDMYPKFISQGRIQQIMLAVQKELLTYGQNV